MATPDIRKPDPRTFRGPADRRPDPPFNWQTRKFVQDVDATTAPINSPTFTGDPKAPTPATADNDTSIATTAFVKAQGYATTAYVDSADALKAPLASPTFTGDPQAPTPATADNDTSIATTAFVKAQGYQTKAGRTNATNPAAGEIGEFVQANKTTSSGSLTAATIGTYHSTTLTAGDWDVWVHSTVVAAATPGSIELELTTGSSLSGSNLAYVNTQCPVGSASHTVDIQSVRFNVSAPTTINLNYRAGVTGMSIANAYIAARRRS